MMRGRGSGAYEKGEHIMGLPVREIRGVTSELAEMLKGHEVFSSDDLLARSTTPRARKELAATLGVGVKLVLELANRADLARITGIGAVFSNLLEEAGVDTVKELASRRPDNLRAKLVEVNAASDLAGRLPTEAQIADWVAQAKELPRALEY